MTVQEDKISKQKQKINIKNLEADKLLTYFGIKNKSSIRYFVFQCFYKVYSLIIKCLINFLSNGNVNNKHYL